MVQIDNSRYCSYGYDQRIEVFGEKVIVATQNVLENRLLKANESGHHSARAKYLLNVILILTKRTTDFVTFTNKSHQV